jgi:chemotaxis protein methyltransferase CheR
MPLNILIIIENEEFCSALSGVLAADGHAVACVTGIREAVNAVKTGKSDLIILEVAAEKVGALETRSRLQRMEETRHIPLIVISEYPELEFELLKVFDFIPKPVNMERLREDIAALDKGGKKRPALPLRIEPLSDSNYQLIRDYLVAFSGLHFERRNIRALERALVNRMTALKINSYLEYFDYLILHRDSRQELQKLLQYLTIGETYFFRYGAHLSALRRIVAEEFALKKEKRLRLWSAGCSTGEEPYSLAMAIMEALPDWREWDIKILATDINNRSLQLAREGMYRAWAMRVTDERYLARYFTKHRDKYALKQEVKDLVEFSHLNLQVDEFPTPDGEFRALDAIFCRNVMIYFTFDTTKQIVEKLTACLNSGGYLFLGHSETLAHISSRYERLSQEGGFYYRKRDGQPGPQRPEAKPVQPAKPAPVKSGVSIAKPVTVTGGLHPAKPSPVPTLAAAKPTWDVEAVYRQAQLQFDAENFAEASRLLREVTRVEPGHLGALVLQGFIAANREQYEDVLTVCDVVLALNDLHPEVYFLKGLVLDMMDKLHDAAAEYRKAILLDMDAVMPHYNLARLYLRLGREKDGLRELKNCLKILEKSREECIVPYSGGLTREVFLEQLRNELFKVA